jgi:hypothetical protein
MRFEENNKSVEGQNRMRDLMMASPVPPPDRRAYINYQQLVALIVWKGHISETLQAKAGKFGMQWRCPPMIIFLFLFARPCGSLLFFLPTACTAAPSSFLSKVVGSRDDSSDVDMRAVKGGGLNLPVGFESDGKSKMRRTGKKVKMSEETRLKISATMKKRCADPEVRKRTSENVKKLHAEGVYLWTTLRSKKPELEPDVEQKVEPRELKVIEVTQWQGSGKRTPRFEIKWRRS